MMTMVSALRSVEDDAAAGTAVAGTAVPSDVAVPSHAVPSHAMGSSNAALPRQRVPATALSQLAQARSGLAEARSEADPGTRYICAHLAALRAAAAIVTARAQPGPGSRRRRPRSVWEMLPLADPTLSEWAAFFAASAAKRAAAEAGLPRAASAREAEDLIGDVETFLRVAERALGIDVQLQLPLRPAS
jgi:hypothetical protein